MCRSETKRAKPALSSLPGAALLCAVLLLGACASAPDAPLLPPPPPPAPPLQFAQGPDLPQPAPAPVYAPRALPPGLLAAPPADARPGECFARVRVPGEPLPQPPAQPQAVWVLTPPGPGQGTPMWCLYLEPGAPAPPRFAPDRFGWIRVVCDEAANAGVIRHVQTRLKAWGYYGGPETGRFDAPTARAVRRFQEERRIDHAGYLSYPTLDALNAPPAGDGRPFPPQAFAGPGEPVPNAYGPVPQPGPYGLPPVGPRPLGPYGAPTFWSCGASCPPPAYPRADEGRPPYLSWPGKTLY